MHAFSMELSVDSTILNLDAYFSFVCVGNESNPVTYNVRKKSHIQHEKLLLLYKSDKLK